MFYTQFCYRKFSTLYGILLIKFFCRIFCYRKLVIRTNIHTYIIGHYNPSVKIIDLVSHTIYVVCVLILYMSGETYSLKSTPSGRLLREIRRTNTFFVFCFDVWPGARTLVFRLISQHTIY